VTPAKRKNKNGNEEVHPNTNIKCFNLKKLYKARATAKAPSAAPMGRIKISPAAFDVAEEAAVVEWDDDVTEVTAAVEVSEELALAVDVSDDTALALELVSALVVAAEAAV
jgi:hypothetical protein